MNPVRPNPDPLRPVLAAARLAGIEPTEVARAAGMKTLAHFAQQRGGDDTTAERILDAVEYLISSHRWRLNRAQKALQAVRSSPPESRFPAGVLRDLITADCGGLKQAVDLGRITDADRRQLYRADTVDLATADRLCVEFGAMLDDLYDHEGVA